MAVGTFIPNFQKFCREIVGNLYHIKSEFSRGENIPAAKIRCFSAVCLPQKPMAE